MADKSSKSDDDVVLLATVVHASNLPLAIRCKKRRAEVRTQQAMQKAGIILPLELLLLCFSWLEWFDIGIARQVCKRWRDCLRVVPQRFKILPALSMFRDDSITFDGKPRNAFWDCCANHAWKHNYWHILAFIFAAKLSRIDSSRTLVAINKLRRSNQWPLPDRCCLNYFKRK